MKQIVAFHYHLKLEINILTQLTFYFLRILTMILKTKT